MTIEQLGTTGRDMRGFNEEDVKKNMEEIEGIVEQTGWEIKDVIEVYKLKEIERLTNCYIDNGNNFDVQILNIFDEMKKINEKLDNLIFRIEDKIK